MPKSSFLFKCFVFLLLLVLLEGAERSFDWIRSVLPLSDAGWKGILATNGVWMISFALFAGPLMVVEYLLPGSKTPKHYARAFLFWAMYMPFAWASSTTAGWIAAQWNISPLLDLSLNQWSLVGFPRLLVNALLLIFTMVMFDLFLYWFHRLQHTSALMWRFHQVHHANRSLNAIGCYHHPLEDVWRIPLFLLPMAVAFRIDAPQMMFLSGFISCWAYWSHMDSQLHFGRLRCVFVDNRYHRLHHSIKDVHFNKNFASYFAPWDKLFGTQCMPDADSQEVLEVGLSDADTPHDLWSLWTLPFKRKPVSDV